MNAVLDLHDEAPAREAGADLHPSTAIICMDGNGAIIQANRQASMLFDLDLPGRQIGQVLQDAEKLGTTASGSAARIAAALLAGEPAHLFQMRDGRSVMLNMHPLPASRRMLEFTDVSYAINTALSEQRDVLTGLPSRPALLRRLASFVGSPARRSALAILYIDLDRFKMVNDGLGHPVGDALLKLVSERLSRLIGPDDLLVRLSGDEFVILQDHEDAARAAEALASRIVEVIGRAFLIHGHSVQVGASVGISLGASDGETAEELIKNADLALVNAKSNGRSAFRFFTEAMNLELQARRALETDLRRALAMQEFSLAYQPQFRIDGNRLVGFEALVRWISPRRGPVSPAEFIPLAEEIGLIHPLGEWVLRQACRDAALWPEPLSVSVNLSPLQFKDPKLVSIIASALTDSGLPPSRLDLEMTEGALIDDTENVLASLRQMKDLGIRISIDDFGTGYSSLSYLQKFPFDKIKIDQSFIRTLETSQDSASIVRAVTALGESLGMMTIAEGVETESQLQRIASEGCQQVQGYLTGKPMSASQAAMLIENRS